jgi:CRISPR-associated protein Csd1
MGIRGGAEMILQALYDLSKRIEEFAPNGMEYRGIPFKCVLTQDGQFIHLVDTRTQQDKKKIAQSFLVPSLGESKGNGIKANLLWENSEYMFGITSKEDANSKRIQEQSLAFKNKILSTLGTKVAKSPWKELLIFLEHIDPSLITLDPLWPEAKDGLFVLAMDGYGELTNHPDIQEALNESESADSSVPTGICLITGKKVSLTRLIPPVKGVRNANPTGAGIVAVNNKISNGSNQGATPSFASYLKQQGYNSPISEDASENFSKALNWLLDPNPNNPHKIQIGDATTVFWSKQHSSFENSFASFFGFVPKNRPDDDVRAVRGLYESVNTGYIPESENEFFVLGLAPNSARISIRFWQTGKIAEFTCKIKQHFDDMEIVRSSNDNGNYSLFYHLKDIVLNGEIEKLPPNLPGDTMRAILTNGTYPAVLMQQTMRRIRAEQSRKEKWHENVTRMRASLLKAYLNRYYRIHKTTEQEITVSLDPNNNNPGYRLGRLFAVLEKIQEDAQPGINATIRDRFYGAASSSPVSVFPQLLKLKNHHLAKIENAAFRGAHEKRLTEIFAGLTADMPAHLAMEDQARFAIGYYHQRQALFTKSNKNDSEAA